MIYFSNGYGHFNQVYDLKKLYTLIGSLKIPYLGSMTLRTEKCEYRISADKINFLMIPQLHHKMMIENLLNILNEILLQ